MRSTEHAPHQGFFVRQGRGQCRTRGGKQTTFLLCTSLLQFPLLLRKHFCQAWLGCALVLGANMWFFDVIAQG